MRPYYIVARRFAYLTIILLIIAGLLMIAVSVVQWRAVYLQLIQGDGMPLLYVEIEFVAGLLYLIVARVCLYVMRKQQIIFDERKSIS